MFFDVSLSQLEPSQRELEKSAGDSSSKKSRNSAVEQQLRFSKSKAKLSPTLAVANIRIESGNLLQNFL
jgi:hypothetical protein